MAIYKNANLDISVDAVKAQTDNSKPSFQFSTQDKNTAKYTFTVKQNKKPVDLTDVKASVTLYSEDKSVFQSDATVTNAAEGKVEYVIPAEAIRHHGKTRGDLRLTYPNGDVLGGLRFSFNIEQALIDRAAGTVGGVYIRDFETLKAEIQKTADSIKDIDVVRIDTKLNELEQKVEEGGVGVDEQARQEIEGLTEQLEDTGRKLNSYETPFLPYKVFEPPLASNKWATTDEIGRVLGMNAYEFLALFYDPLVGTYEDGYKITKSSLGKDQSGQYDLYEYVFTPPNYTKTILLSSGMHPTELPASFGLAHFMNHLMVKPYAHSGFKYLYENVRIKIIPVINPWGFSQNPIHYANSRGVNINRNFDSDGKWAIWPDDGDEFNKKGSAPYSEAETVILRDWATANKTAAFWMDCHTGANSPHADVYLIYLSQDKYMEGKLLSAVGKLEDRIRVKYGREPIPRIVVDNPGSIRQNFAYEQLGLHTFTLEGVNSWGTPANNEAEDITEYEVAISGCVFELLDVESVEMQEFHKANKYSLNHLQKQLETQSSEKVDKVEEVKALEQLDVVLLDRFNRKNQIGLGKAETGQEWTVHEGSYYEVKNGKAFGNDRASINTGISDYILSVDIEWHQYAGVLVRFLDPLNHFQIRINNTGLGMFKLVNGASSPIGDYAFAPTKGRKYKLTVTAKNNDITVYLDDVLRIQASDSQFNKETKIGIRAVADNNARFDNLLVRKFPKGSDSNVLDLPVTLLNGWTGTVNCTKDPKTGLVMLRGSLQVGNLGDTLAILEVPSGAKPSFSHPFVCYKSATLESLNGFVVASSTGGLYARKPLNTNIKAGDTLIFNTVFHS